MIAVALRTIVSRTPALSNDSTAESGSHPLQTTQAQSAEQQKHGLIVQMTMHAVLRPLIAHVPASSASTSGSFCKPCTSSATQSVSAFVFTGCISICTSFFNPVCLCFCLHWLRSSTTHLLCALQQLILLDKSLRRRILQASASQQGWSCTAIMARASLALSIMRMDCHICRIPCSLAKHFSPSTFAEMQAGMPHFQRVACSQMSRQLLLTLPLISSLHLSFCIIFPSQPASS